MSKTLYAAGVLAGLWLAAGFANISAQQSPSVPPGLARQAAADGTVRVIVEMDLQTVPDALASVQERGAQRANIAAAQDQITAMVPAAAQRGVKRFTTIPYFAIEVTPEGLAELVKAPGVRSVVEDRPDPLALGTSVPQIRAPQAWNLGYDGTGWAVAVLDTGIQSSHPFFGGRVVSEACYSATGDCPNGLPTQTGAGAGAPCTYSSDCFHGTHVGGIAAGALNSTFSGVAKGASLISVQVFSNIPGCSPCAYTSDQILGLERVYALRNTYSIAAVNMSLGGGQSFSTCDSDSRKAIIDNLRAAGIATVIASGNSGYTNSLGFPACISTAISVGSVSDTSNTVSSFSNSASFLTLLAPGAVITSSVPTDLYGSAQGTSMAAPHVAGAWAVLKQKAPAASVSTILAALQNSAPVTDARNGIAKPRIDVMTALSSTSLQTAFTDPTLTAGASVARAVHVSELRSRINTLRIAHGLSAATWTDGPSAGVTPIKAVHITEMRDALTQAFTAAGVTPPAFTDSSLAGVTVRALHVTELRDAVILLEPS